MSSTTKIVGTAEAWEEGLLGRDENFVEQAPDINLEIEAALGLQPISIRLQKSLIEQLKGLAHLNGIGYQPLIRQILTRWVDCEMKSLLREKIAETKLAAEIEIDVKPEEAVETEQKPRTSKSQHRKAA